LLGLLNVQHPQAKEAEKLRKRRGTAAAHRERENWDYAFLVNGPLL
jgi:hypothetical protein